MQSLSQLLRRYGGDGNLVKGRVAAPFAIEARIDVQYTAKGTGLMQGLLSLRLRHVC